MPDTCVYTPMNTQLLSCRLPTSSKAPKGPGQAYVKVLEAFEVILAELGDVIVLQVQQRRVGGDLLGHRLQTWGPVPPSPA